MSAELDAAYRSQRLRLASAVSAATAAAWVGSYRERDRAIATVLPLVEAGQAQTVYLLDAYMAAKVGDRPKGLNAARYTTETLRGLTAEEVYERPFGAYGAALSRSAAELAAAEPEDGVFVGQP